MKNTNVVKDKQKIAFIQKCIINYLKSSYFNVSYSAVSNSPYFQITMIIEKHQKVLMAYESTYKSTGTAHEYIHESLTQKLQGVTLQEEEMYLALLKVELS